MQDFLQVALDVTGDGRLGLPPYMTDFMTGFHNVTIFLSSYDTGLNLTITNGTASAGNASLGNIFDQEPDSTVKHVNWIWPSCLVGDGGSSDSTRRGDYNVSSVLASETKALFSVNSLVVDHHPTKLSIEWDRFFHHI